MYTKPVSATLALDDESALGGDFALVEAGGSRDFSESNGGSARLTGDNEYLDVVVEGDAKLGVVRPIRWL